MKTLPIKLDFVRVLTDDLGMIQHSKYSTPNREERYAIDDNARALIACTNYFMLFYDTSALKLIDKCQSIVLHAKNRRQNAQFSWL